MPCAWPLLWQANPSLMTPRGSVVLVANKCVFSSRSRVRVLTRANTNNMLLASAVVVWEWLNEHGRWRPYSPAVSHQIEAAIRSSDPRGGSVVLGQVDSRLSPYIIDLQSMHQFRQDTGETGRGCNGVMFVLFNSACRTTNSPCIDELCSWF